MFKVPTGCNRKVQDTYKQVGPFTIEMFEKVAKVYGFPFPSFNSGLTEFTKRVSKDGEVILHSQYCKLSKKLKGIRREQVNKNYLIEEYTFSHAYVSPIFCVQEDRNFSIKRSIVDEGLGRRVKIIFTIY